MSEINLRILCLLQPKRLSTLYEKLLNNLQSNFIWYFLFTITVHSLYTVANKDADVGNT